jgi:hypothetical protein
MSILPIARGGAYPHVSPERIDQHGTVWGGAAHRARAPERMTLALLAVFMAAMAQQRERRVEPAAIPVRYAEGTVHGFLELRTATGALLAHGDLLQVARDRQIERRMVFHFSDASVFEEAVTFTQQGVFTMQNYHLVQSGPAFADDLEVTLSRSGQSTS